MMMAHWVQIFKGLSLAVLVACLCSFTPAHHADSAILADLFGADPIKLDAITLEARSYPQALPNDGYSEATISVKLISEGKPVAERVVRAEVAKGDGFLGFSEAVTNTEGVAKFNYRAGLMPEAGEVKVLSPDTGLQTTIKIPLAPVTYLDVRLVTPEEYAAHRQRQASAAPIYTLTIDAFPQQLAADGGSLATVTATLKQADGKAAPGVPLKAEIISGEGDLDISQKATDKQGKFSFYFTPGFMPGTATIRVLEPSTGLVAAVDILLVEAGPARVELYYIDPFASFKSREGALLPADGVTGLPMVAEVTNLQGIPLSGVELKLEVLDLPNGWLECLDPVSDASGEVEFTYHAGSITGPVRLRAYVASGLPLVQNPVVELQP
jgi:hypothetical protein